MGINNLKRILGNNKDKILKFGLGLLGTAAGLALAGVFTEDESVEIEEFEDGSGYAVTEVESPEETATEIVEG